MASFAAAAKDHASGAKSGPGERQGEEDQEQAAEQEQEAILDLQLAFIPLDHDLEEAHGGPLHPAHLAAHHHVNDDGSGNRGDAGEEPGV